MRSKASLYEPGVPDVLIVGRRISHIPVMVCGLLLRSTEIEPFADHVADTGWRSVCRLATLEPHRPDAEEL